MARSNHRRRSSETDAREDAVGQYLEEIGNYPLLTADDEVELAKRIERGNRAAEALGSAELTSTERAKLQLAAKRGLDARRQFINSNLRLVVSIAKRYVRSDLSFLDLVQEGNLGLIRAVEKFD